MRERKNQVRDGRSILFKKDTGVSKRERKRVGRTIYVL